MREKQEPGVAGADVGVTPEFMADIEWWRWYLTKGVRKRGEKMSAPFSRFVRQPHKSTCLSNASFQAAEGLCMETGVYWR